MQFSDLSAGDRIGFKGPASTGWLAPRVAGLPPHPNRFLAIAPDLVIGRLSASEYTIVSLAGAPCALVERLRTEWQAETPAGCHVVPRFHSQALFRLEGERTFDLLAKMSPVDFRGKAFPEGAIAQTTCAKVVVQLYCLTRTNRPGVLVAVDSTLATHLAECMADAMAEYS